MSLIFNDLLNEVYLYMHLLKLTKTVDRLISISIKNEHGFRPLSSLDIILMGFFKDFPPHLNTLGHVTVRKRSNTIP